MDDFDIVDSITFRGSRDADFCENVDGKNDHSRR